MAYGSYTFVVVVVVARQRESGDNAKVSSHVGLSVSTLQPGLLLWIVRASYLRQAHSCLSVDAAAVIEKLDFFRNQSGKFEKPSRFCATVSKHSFCSCFKPEI